MRRFARHLAAGAAAALVAAPAFAAPAPDRKRVAWTPLPTLPLAPPRASPPKPLPDMIADVFPSLVRVQGAIGERRVGGGSGFVVSEDGLVVTNDHVISSLAAAGATEVLAIFDDGRVFALEPLASDAEADVAVARLIAPAGTRFAALRFGASGALRRGDAVTVLGAPLGGSLVPAHGVLGGSRHVADDELMHTVLRSRGDWHLLQVDAAMSSGSSGGPIVDAAGDVVGVSVLVQTSGGAGVGALAYGVAADQVRPIINALLARGAVRRPAVGLSVVVVDAHTAAREAAASGVALLPPGAATGLLVTAAAPGRPGAAAGLQPGDVIVALDGAPMRRNGDFFAALGPVFEPGRTLAASIWRPRGPGRGGDALEMALAPAPRDEAAHEAAYGLRRSFRHW
jgi:S1-C subfamily serine protease